jgi:5-methylcytosine-specific restriction endonuclease McrA
VPVSDRYRRLSGMARGRADIANTALRIFLQDMGAAYDQERGLAPYNGSKDFPEVRAFFGEQCCYCGTELEPNRVAQDHLVPMNKKSLGLHAWGNVVPACQDCNAKKQGKEWHAYLVTRAGERTPERYERVTAFVAKYKYDPDPNDLRDTAEELYEEVGSIAMTLIGAKVKRVRDKL